MKNSAKNRRQMSIKIWISRPKNWWVWIVGWLEICPKINYTQSDFSWNVTGQIATVCMCMVLAMLKASAWSPYNAFGRLGGGHKSTTGFVVAFFEAQRCNWVKSFRFLDIYFSKLKNFNRYFTNSKLIHCWILIKYLVEL